MTPKPLMSQLKYLLSWVGHGLGSSTVKDKVDGVREERSDV